MRSCAPSSQSRAVSSIISSAVHGTAPHACAPPDDPRIHLGHPLVACLLARRRALELNRIPLASIGAAVGAREYFRHRLVSRSRNFTSLRAEAAKPQDPPAYGEGASYWDKRYQQKTQPFEWLRDYDDLRETIESITHGNRRLSILNVGCGSSEWTEEMYDEGYHNITNVDISSVVIEQMQARNAHRTGMTWRQMDATSMAFEAASFDIVMEKSVLDTFACMTSRTKHMVTYLNEMSRVLRPGGKFLCISYGTPAERLGWLEAEHCRWIVSVVEYEPKSSGSSIHYSYICTKSSA